MDPSDEQLRQLLELGDVDSEIRRLRRRLDDLDEQKALDAALAEREEMERARADRRLDRDAVQARAAKEDQEVDQLRQRLAAEQQRMYGGQISNPRELQSLRAEIEAVEARIDEHETAELEAMEEVDRLESEIADLERRIEEHSKRIIELTGARDEAASTMLATIAELEVAREKHREPLSAELLATYDEYAEKFGGTAVGRLDGDRCTACGISLSYADVNELMEGPSLARCPQCRRLLVIL